jgi:hypothetical protein
VHDEHRRGDDHARVVDPEEPAEEPALGEGEQLLQREHDEQHDEAQREEVRVREPELRELPRGEVVRLGELAVEQAGEHPDDHVGE